MNRADQKRVVTLFGLLLAASVACANNLQVANVAVSKRDGTTAFVTFDIAWQNAWRYTNVNHDAAWVVFKVRQENGTEWQHVKLAYTGVNPSAYSNGVGTAVDLIVPSDGAGLFVRRASEGFGALAVTNVRAVWQIPAGTLVKSGKIVMRALAMEMVYVAEGAFQVGSGGTETGSLTDGAWTSGATIPFQGTSRESVGDG